MPRPLNNFHNDVCDQFERFLGEIEARDPPSLNWIKSQRQMPEILRDEWSPDQICAVRHEYTTRMVGHALQHLVRDSGLQLPDGWKDDFAFNFDIVQRQIIDLFELGAWPAPAYSKRIGVLLRRANRRELSDRFDVDWARIAYL